MLFNSGTFLQFLAAFLLLYWLVRDHLRARNVLIVAASYLFYGWWNWKFLGLLFFSSSFDFFVGRALEALPTTRHRKLLLAASIVVNLGILGFFKYGNFFVDSLATLLARLDIPFHPGTLHVILPVGISFYTFQSMSYAIDVYRRQVPATRNFLNFLAFVSFFPQLVAGPIQRAAHLLPQFERTRVITRAMLAEGVWLILWGLFKKVALADNFAPLVEIVYHGASYSAATVALGTIAFGLQIYCDFSGYPDIARGVARALGFDIMWNFNLPYAATSLRDFWRRWHISFSTWLRDYLYISLGGNRHGATRTGLNLLLTMLLGGLWHGAAWNYVLWGAWHGLVLVAERRLGGFKNGSDTERGRPVPAIGCSAAILRGRGRPHPFPKSALLGWLLTMLGVGYGWLLFRARSWDQIVAMTRALGDVSAPIWIHSFLLNLVVFAAPLLAMELWQHRAGNRLAPLSLRSWARHALQGALLIGILIFWQKDKTPFIYFQF